MKQKYRFLAMILVSAMLFSNGCGFGSQADGQQTEEQTESSSTVNEENEIQEDETTQEEATGEETGEYQIDTVKFTAEEKLVYNDWELEVLGFEEREEIATEAYTDRPAEGNVFLILYLRIYNKTDKEHYFAPDNLETTIDGKSVETTYLVNAPHEYETMFRTYEATELSAGFIVWEVPKGWKNLKLVYHGWEVDYFMKPVLKLKHKDLSEPVDYDPVYLT